MKVINGEKVATKYDLKNLRGRYQTGYKIKIVTPVYVDSLRQKHLHVTAHIIGVYPMGLLVWFWHRNVKGLQQLKRWVSYLDILEAEQNGEDVYVSRGDHLHE